MKILQALAGQLDHTHINKRHHLTFSNTAFAPLSPDIEN